MTKRTSSFIPHPSSLRAFTLVELLIVVGIIGVLAAILFPVIGKVRQSAYETDSRAMLTSIEGACQAYYQDYNSYPGPLSALEMTASPQRPIMPLGGSTAINLGTVDGSGTIAGTRITGSENAVLGLLGGLVFDRRGPTPILQFDPNAVGQGPANLNPLRPGRGTSYFQQAKLSPGLLSSTPGVAMDTVIPEFLDKFPADPMPILIMRARLGARSDPDSTKQPSATNNNVVVNVPYGTAGWQFGQYNLLEVTPYTLYLAGGNKPHGLKSVDAGLGKSINKNRAEYQVPYEAFSYLADPSTYDFGAAPSATINAAKKARKTDTMILIAAGKDRIYGTNDDITNFGSVLP